MSLFKAILAIIATVPGKPRFDLGRKKRQETWTPQWADDRLGYWPVNDRGGGIYDFEGPGDNGMLGVLARIELNEEDGRKLESGLSKHPLQPPEAGSGSTD